MLAVIGLGNVGSEYDDTRHNIGFRVVDELAGDDVAFERRVNYLCHGVRITGRKVLLVKPTTYMNLSGDAVKRVAREHKLAPDQTLVLSDDIHLPLGRLRIRKSGSDGGQKGLASIIETTGTNQFPRLRLGVGAPPDNADWADYVLRPFDDDERELVDDMVTRARDCVRTWVHGGIGRAMERHNRSPNEEPKKG